MSFFTLFELDPESTLAKEMFKTKLRCVVASSIISTTIAVLMTPVAGAVCEIMIFPAFCIKKWRVDRALRWIEKNGEKGKTYQIKYGGEWQNVKMVGKEKVEKLSVPVF